ncbi:hypothetical protein SWPG_00128 [Synechococcus phage S-CBM2]|nr:hypothetical protein SWPG_00128 [Synechococcus phage S-CBM2]
MTSDNMILFDPRKKKEKEETPPTTAVIIGGVLAFLSIPAILMLLWNWLMPFLFSLPTIGYFKAGGLFIMSYILFKK